MATVKLRNTTEADITISAMVGKELIQATVPAARQNPDDRAQLIPGYADVDEALIEATAGNRCVQAYFAEGMLIPEATSRTTKTVKTA